MIIRLIATALIALIVMPNARSQDEVSRGAQAYRQCAACHSLETGLHLTGPSLSGVVGRPAGRAPGFKRYSSALKGVDFSWTEEMLDRWLENPAELVPGTSMRIRPVVDASIREDIINFLMVSQAAGDGTKGNSRMPNLKQVPPGRQVTDLKYCPDAYQVTVATGDTYTFWEFNLRFKTDSSLNGPQKGRPVMVGQGMQGDRAQVVFSAPTEISSFIRRECSND
jgi:cytochrome c